MEGFRKVAILLIWENMNKIFDKYMWRISFLVNVEDSSLQLY